MNTNKLMLIALMAMPFAVSAMKEDSSFDSEDSSFGSGEFALGGDIHAVESQNFDFNFTKLQLALDNLNDHYDNGMNTSTLNTPEKALIAVKTLKDLDLGIPSNVTITRGSGKHRRSLSLPNINTSFDSNDWSNVSFIRGSHKENQTPFNSPREFNPDSLSNVTTRDKK